MQEVGIFSSVRSTHPDNVKVTIPNSAVYGQTIKNYTANDTRRNDLVVGISYGDDIARAIETIQIRCSPPTRECSTIRSPTWPWPSSPIPR